MTISQAAAQDAEAILKLQKLAYQSEAKLYNDDSIPPLRQTVDEIKAEFSKQTFLKATENGQIVGAVRAYVKDDTCYIGRLIVHPDFQGQGIGTALMRAIENEFPNVKRFELFTGSRSVDNIRLYDRLGYKTFKTEMLNDQVTLVFLEKLK